MAIPTHAASDSSGRAAPSATHATRRPILTVGVTLLTGVVSCLAFVDPVLQAELRRDPSALASGQWWRLASPLLVRTDTWWELAVVLAGTLAGGWIVEARFRRLAWLALYLGAGLVGQAAGYLWDPT